MKLSLSLAGLLVVLPLAACRSSRVVEGPVPAQAGTAAARAIVVPASAGLTAVEANWKERLEQPYVFIEQRGDYRRLGDAMRRVLAAAEAQGLELDGTPFALFYDDPGRTPVGELRARACLPVAARPGRLGELAFDVLPRAMVVYARVPGPYPEVPRSYPALFAYLEQLGSLAGGPVRELYLVNPVEAANPAELWTEVQIPWTARPQ
jgi:effector-binding domain-containing protein